MESSLVKFGELKNEERYKRLEQNLKLAFVKQMERVKAGEQKKYCISPSWPSLSSICPDGIDTSCTQGIPSLHVSRVESEVLSSSKNLRKVLAVHQNGHIQQRPTMATSSVKKFSVNGLDKDRAIMPPPSTVSLYNVNKISNVPDQSQQNNGKELESKVHDSSYQDSHFAQSDSHDVKKDRVFTRWRVLLNDQGQLIIKGILECGKTARSKPVIQRFTNTQVLSIYKHIYILDGNIVDDRNELPDYVRGKFHNGFPDDWENVYQLWRNYIAGGCQVTFRWPTPITDSDDDLHSEITDFSYFKSKQVQYKDRKQLSTATTNNTSSLGYHSKVQSDSNQNFQKFKQNNETINLTEHENQIIMNKKINDSGHSSDIKDADYYNNECCADNISKSTQSSGSNGSNLKNISFLYDIIQEEKVRIILSNLRDRNCPAQYLDKFIDLIDCLKYLLSYNATKNNETESREKYVLQSKNSSQECLKCSNTALFSNTQEINLENQRNINCNKSEEININTRNGKYLKTIENSPNKANYKQCQVENVNNNISNESSDSDDYMGYPNISLDHLIKPKITKYQRYKDRKNCNKDRKNNEKNVQIEEQIEPLDKKCEEHYSSSVSISEDDNERRIQEQKKVLFPSSASKDKEKILDIESSKHTNIKKIITNDVNNKCDDDGFKVPLTVTKTNKKSTEIKKPVIKSCEPAQFDIQLRYTRKGQTIENSDVSVIEDDISSNKENNQSNCIRNNNETTANISEGLIQHRFLTYDSEDFLNEEEINLQVELSSNDSNKTQNKVHKVVDNSFDIKKTSENSSITKIEKHNKAESEVKSSPVKKKTLSSTKIVKNQSFGSKENPKVLASWIPSVVYDDELKKCSLAFEGKLLNEAGHILHRKFITDPIRQRHSATLIETVNDEYYKLFGELNDTKHIVPKELLKQCRSGCPSKIKEFCEQWKRLKSVVEKSDTAKSTVHDASINLFTVATSSRGRRIVPALNYWEGERIVTKDNDTTYTPGRMQDTALMQTSFKSEKKNMSFSEQQLQKNSSKKETVSQRTKSSNKSTKIENKTSNLKAKEKPANKRIAHTLNYTSSSDSDEKKSPNKKNLRRPKKKINLNPSLNQPKSKNSQSKLDTLTESAYNTKLRKRQRLEVIDNQQPKKELTKRRLRVSTNNPDSEVVWTYEKEHGNHDILSDDQASFKYC